MHDRSRAARRNWSVYPLAVACLAALAAAVLVVGPPTTATGTSERIVTVARGVVQSTVSGTGTVEAARQLDVSFETGGTLTHVYVKPGQRIVEGQTLAAIDPTDAQAALDQAQASLAAAEAAPVAAPSPSPSTTPSAGRGGQSGASGGSSGSSGGETAAQKAANVATAQAAVDKAQAALAQTMLTAPMTGVVASVGASVGEQVSGGGSAATSGSGSSGSGGSGGGSGAGSGGGSGSGSSSAAFVVLADLDAMNVVVPFSESDVGKLRPGQPATITVNALPNEQLAAHVISIATLPTSSSGVVSYDATLRLDQLAHGLKPGMTASAQVVVERVGDALNVASAAISGRGANASVMLVQGTRRVRRAVVAGVVGDSTTQILGGLRDGDRVAIVTRLPSASATSGFGGGAGAGGTLGGGGGGFRRFGSLGGGGPVVVGPAGGGGPGG